MKNGCADDVSNISQALFKICSANYCGSVSDFIVIALASSAVNSGKSPSSMPKRPFSTRRSSCSSPACFAVVRAPLHLRRDEYGKKLSVVVGQHSETARTDNSVNDGSCLRLKLAQALLEREGCVAHAQVVELALAGNIPDVRLERLAGVLVKSPDFGLRARTEIPQQKLWNEC